MTTKKESVEAYLENRISFDKLMEEIGEENAEAVKASKQMLKQGEEIAEALTEN
ncbi:MAG: hypothetical protein U5J64_08050 [Halobacteriales archaeon]|nr:hypothetical protein [Halobacteriales archaeon]